jgi:hypothetical protein
MIASKKGQGKVKPLSKTQNKAKGARGNVN